MTLLLDTSVLIDHLRGNEAARRALATAVDDGERLVSSVVVKVEVLAGMRSAEEHHTRRLLDALDWIPSTTTSPNVRVSPRVIALGRSHAPRPGCNGCDYVGQLTATARMGKVIARFVNAMTGQGP
jgi:predicted nucleic acid-binding protein